MRKLNRDGVTLAHQEAGSGDPPLVFVPGWTCDRTFFTPQVEHFGRAHRVVAVDLRGHGESDAPAQDYTIAGHAEDVAWLCDQLDIRQPVVVGHSFGGCVALELAARRPPLLAGIVMIEAPVVSSPDRRAWRLERAQALRSEDRDVPRRILTEAYVLPTDERVRLAGLIERMLSAPVHAAVSEIERYDDWDSAAAAAACEVPALFINAAHPRPELDRLRELCPRLWVAQTACAGHFNMLEVPDQVNTMIERFLAISIPLRAR